ncbi:MAG: undecaprenyl-diphosphate phosphatase [Candidatus Nanoarchaeia archaeon]|nr:undecaprenyl-diphosphate phosphatase [Candidatus Nanoarchaeia archaeon]
MDLIIYAIAGFLQGIVEWIPLSSQGVVSFFLVNMGYEFSKAIDVSLFLHAGTMLAVISYFKKDVKKMVYPKNPQDFNLLRFILISVFFSLLIGSPVYFILKSYSFDFSSANIFIGAMLFITGGLQMIRKKFSAKKIDSKVSVADSIISGSSQGFSVIPGISRSGITIFAFLLRGFTPEYSMKLSFLMSVPVVLAESVYLAIFEGFAFRIEYLIGGAVAFFVGRMTIGLFLKIAKKIDFSVFCILLGALSIASTMF